LPIPTELSAEFPAIVRARGDEYWREGRVHITKASHDRLDARVRGSRSYHVTLERERGGTVALACSCPYVEEYETPCKHLWATMLEADRMGHPLLDDAPKGPTTTISAPPPLRTPRVPIVADWKRELGRLAAQRPFGRGAREAATWPADRRVAYIVDVAASPAPEHGLILELATQAAVHDEWRAPRRFGYTIAQWLATPDLEDREIAQMLLGAREELAYGYAASADAGGRPRRFFLASSAFSTTLRRICETGRCRIRLAATEESDDPPSLVWDSDGTWELRLALVPHGEERCRLDAMLVRGRERVPLADATLAVPGLVVFEGTPAVAAPFEDFGASDIVRELRSRLVLEADFSAATDLATELGALVPRLPAVELPDALGIVSVRVAPRPVLVLRATKRSPSEAARAESVDAVISFDYDGTRVLATEPGTVVLQPDAHRAVHRDRSAEAALVARLDVVGFRREHANAHGPAVHRISLTRALRAAGELAAEGWEVELDSRRVREAGNASLRVRSGIDWFELDGTIEFDGLTGALPDLLTALRRGERSMTLSDGSIGVVPDAWLARYRTLAALGVQTDDALRFGRGQVALLDALLAGGPNVEIDETFTRARDELRHAGDVAELDPPAGFVGELRPYQRSGLGWLEFLRRFGFGGILADDMGLGKTVQVLALLEMRREAAAGPSLAVVPRSLVFNWVSEAARFTPQLRVLVHHGTGRGENVARLHEYDLVITTYGTLRRDATGFRDLTFDYVILDEAQAIKNASTATAKAARLLPARHRLVMSGTPIENRLDDLWSLFEFLNPGMLGAAPAFARLVKAGADGGDDGRAIVARGVRPFLLRRTKAQVARELPERVEQTVWVDLGTTERRLYDELRAHYRNSLLGRVARDGVARSRMHVLEALLRLRQAASHPGLVDPTRVGETSTKLEVLASRLAEIVAEGHKALVFSQFTSLLAIVRTRLEADGVTYEYLDGKTRDRARRVEHFQNDASCSVFLVSLKAGGVGLNLTAADYVFLLDPWWNPAAEAQAIDRAHRIGQTRHVLALRLVARGTVEEKVLELQRSKRELADAIIRSDDGGIGKLTAEDIRELLE
jgi:hypothetical protein